MDSKSMQAGMISPRKRMAMDKGAGSMDVGGYPGSKSRPVTGPGGGELADSSRGIGMPVGGGKGRHGQQAAPDHGSMSDHFNRDGKV